MDAEGVAPGRVGLSDVRRVEAAIRRFRAVDHQFGGGSCREAVLAELNTARSMVTASTTDAVRTHLCKAVADLHNLAGWTFFDTGQTRAALTHFTQALELARSGGARDLAANVHYRIGRVHLHHNDSARALTEFERGENLARDGRATLATSLLLVNQAWSHAALGHVDDTLQLLGQAVDTFERAAPATAPSWLAFYDQTDLSGLTGVIYTELAQRVDTSYATFAIPSLTAAVAGYGETMTRSRALSLTALAINHFIDDDAERGAKVGTQALEMAARLKSPRTLERLQPLRNEAHRHHHNTDTQNLIDRLDALCGR
jgi:tetratricopeptide (TPR) repeat protein